MAPASAVWQLRIFFRKEHPDARVLILDNHDDFGGHAKRNEFVVNGKRILGYGGAQTLEEPSAYAKPTKRLLKDIGVDLDYFYKGFDQDFYRRHGLRGAVFFDAANWGTNTLVPYDLGGLHNATPVAPSSDSLADLVAAMPLSPAARDEMLSLLTRERDAMPGLSHSARVERLASISYQDYLRDYLGVTEAEVFAVFERLTTDQTADSDAVPALGALEYVGLPGYAASGLRDPGFGEPYIHHFPDGNASIARLLVRQMIPSVAPGSTMHDVVLADFDYSKLDVADNPTRIRLNSTAVNVQHDGSLASAATVRVRYVRNGKLGQARAKFCVLAVLQRDHPGIVSRDGRRTARGACVQSENADDVHQRGADQLASVEATWCRRRCCP